VLVLGFGVGYICVAVDGAAAYNTGVCVVVVVVDGGGDGGAITAVVGVCFGVVDVIDWLRCCDGCFLLLCFPVVVLLVFPLTVVV